MRPSDTEERAKPAEQCLKTAELAECTRPDFCEREVGAGYFDAVVEAVAGEESSTLGLRGSTEEAQFEERRVA